MGFPLDFVLSEESHYREFVCKICFELVETPVAYTHCSHVFCNSCLQQWIHSNALDQGSGADSELPRVKCPGCGFLLTANKDIYSLHTKEPLAMRLLKNLRCRCPLDRCGWQGDYSELQSHLTNSESHITTKGTITSGAGARAAPAEEVPEEWRSPRGTPKEVPKAPAISAQTPADAGRSEEKMQELSSRPPKQDNDDVPLRPDAAVVGQEVWGEVGTTPARTSSHSLSQEKSTSKKVEESTPGAAQAEQLQEQERNKNLEQLKELGNSRFRAGAFRDAIQLYSKAIAIAPPNTPSTRQVLSRLHANRGACFVEVGAFTEAQEECRTAIQLDPAYAKPYVRLAGLLAQNNKLADGVALLQNSISRREDKQFCAELSSKLQELERVQTALAAGRAALRAGSVHAAVVAFQQAADALSPTPDECLLWLARAHFAAGRNDQANRVCRTVLIHQKKSKSSTGAAGDVDQAAFIVMALVLFLDGSCAQAESVLREALRLNPDAEEAAKCLKSLIKPVAAALREGAERVAVREFEAALVLFEDGLAKMKTAMEVGTSTAKNSTSTSDDENHVKAVALGLGLQNSAVYASLLTEAASCLYRLKKFEDSLKTVGLALYCRADRKEAVILRCNCLVALERYGDAVRSMEDAQVMFAQDAMVQHAHRKAVFELRKSKRPDYYAILSEKWVEVEDEEEEGGISRVAEKPATSTSSAADESHNVNEGSGRQSPDDNCANHLPPQVDHEAERKESSDADFHDGDASMLDMDACSGGSDHEMSASPPTTARDLDGAPTHDRGVVSSTDVEQGGERGTTSPHLLSSFSSLFDIKQAYKARALELHPDKHQTGSVEKQAEAKRRFLLVSEALEILGDETKRKLYDEGYDKEAIADRLAAMNRAK